MNNVFFNCNVKFDQCDLSLVIIQEITVTYPPEEKHQLADAVLLKDALEDLPAVCLFCSQVHC